MKSSNFDFTIVLYFVKVTLKVLGASLLVLLTNCRKTWDPDRQYLSDLSNIEAKRAIAVPSRRINPASSLVIGQTYSEIVSALGTDYKVVGRLDKEDAWMKIEYSNTGARFNRETSSRLELLFKNNRLMEFHFEE